jgi:uncharacterized protein YjbJ (UPF0337 family)
MCCWTVNLKPRTNTEVDRQLLHLRGEPAPLPDSGACGLSCRNRHKAGIHFFADRAAGTFEMSVRWKPISTQQEMTMDWNRIEGNWKQFKGAAKEKWGKLTDDDLNVIEGRREQLEGKLQQRYGFAKDQIHKDVDDWFRTLK